jgi:hypothetical protein
MSAPKQTAVYPWRRGEWWHPVARHHRSWFAAYTGHQRGRHGVCSLRARSQPTTKDRFMSNHQDPFLALAPQDLADVSGGRTSSSSSSSTVNDEMLTMLSDISSSIQSLAKNQGSSSSSDMMTMMMTMMMNGSGSSSRK